MVAPRDTNAIPPRPRPHTKTSVLSGEEVRTSCRFCLEWCFKWLFYYEFLRIAVFRADNVEACSQGYRHAVA